MDFFDRQRRISGWDQTKISSSTAVCFGVGGLGSIVSLNLCRLGIGKLILIDYDNVEHHNLNRQLLFTQADIGQPKVEAAKRSLLANHNLQTSIESFNLDIVKNWRRVIEITEGASVIFNMIDYGDYFDIAAQALAIALKVPFVQGGTFSQCVSVEFFISGGRPCLSCGADMNAEILEMIRPAKIKELEDLSFLPKSENPVGLSNVYLCGVCGMLMTAKYSEFLIASDVQISNRTLFYVNSMEAVNFSVEKKDMCVICGDSST